MELISSFSTSTLATFIAIAAISLFGGFLIPPLPVLAGSVVGGVLGAIRQ